MCPQTYECVSKIQHAKTLRPQPIANCPRGHLQATSPASPIGSSSAIPGLRLHSHNAHLGPLMLDRGRNTAQQSATAHRSQHQVYIRKLLQNLQPHRPLPGNNQRIVIRRNNNIPKLRRKLLSLQFPLGTRRPNDNNLRTQSRSSGTLQLRNIRRHHHNRLHAQSPRRVSHALSMVAARISNHATPALFSRQLRNRLISPAQALKLPVTCNPLFLRKTLPQRRVQTKHKRNNHRNARNPRARRQESHPE